jgi:hypothetical protein
MENPFDEISDFDTVYLSTRITQTEHKMLNEIQGWLQTANQTATVRKQEAVRRTIRMAYEFLQTQLAHMDEIAATESAQIVDNSPTPEIVVDISPTKPTQDKFDNMIDTYREIANKKVYEPRSQIVHTDSRAIELRKRLGL